jgi:hypothetical protein
MEHFIHGDGQRVFITNTTIASESPTRMESIPALSIAIAVG